MRAYRLLGVTLGTAFELPLSLATAPVEVIVERGDAPPAGEELWSAHGVRCRRDAAAVYVEVKWGRFRVTSEHVAVCSERIGDAIHPLLTVVWSVVLAARGREPLHGSVVARDGVALAILGPSGAGKSTAAWSLVQRGWWLVSDDLVALDDRGGAHPGTGSIRLAAGADAGVEADGKVAMATRVVDDAVPLTCVVVLKEGATEVRRMGTAEAVGALLRNMYNPVDTHDGQPAARFRMLLDLVGRARVYAAPARGVDAGRLEAIMAGAE